MSNDLVTFLLARIQEDEQIAHVMREAWWPDHVAVRPSDDTGPSTEDYPRGVVSIGPHWPRGGGEAVVCVWDPGRPAEWESKPWGYIETNNRSRDGYEMWSPQVAARRLIEAETKRRIIDQIIPNIEYRDLEIDLLKLLALSYANHPDYQQEWWI
jgi:hypothetical protein